MGRFGTTYYAARVSAILPQALFHQLFGTESGFLLLRILLASVAGYAFFRTVESWFSRILAYFLVPFLVVNPVLTRALAWDYVDGFAVTYMFASVGCFVAGSRWPSRMVSGIFAAMATNCYLGSFAYLGAFFVGCGLVDWWQKGRIPFKTKYLPWFAGFLGFYVMTSLILWILFPAWGPAFEFKTIKVGFDLARGGSKVWWVPVWNYLEKNQFYILYPFAFCLASCWIWWSKSRNKVNQGRSALPAYAVIPIYLCFVCSGILIQHLILRMPIFIFYAISYSLPAVMLGVAYLIHQTKLDESFSTKKIIFYQGAGCLVLAEKDFWISGLISNSSFWTATILICAIYVLFCMKQKMIGATLALSFFTILPFNNFENPNTLGHLITPAIGKKNRNRIIEISYELNNQIKSAVSNKKNLKIWFYENNSPYVVAIASWFFYGYSALFLDGVIFSAQNSEKLHKSLEKVDLLVLLSTTPEALDSGEQKVISLEPEKWKKIGRKEFTIKNNSKISYTLLKKQNTR
ncbi:MAG: hypothetical protein EBR01_12910 [Proteobacteria bacterium]|nr:hypothetical protein [Pseudomonadota bacterium]